MFPIGVAIEAHSGAVRPFTGRYVKRLAELRGIFQSPEDFERAIIERKDPVIYEVVEYKIDGSDLFFGTTTMYPGSIGGEYHMTRGHFHARDDRGEVYYTQSGSGILILENREGETRWVSMAPGICAFIPPGWAHRSIVVGNEKLVFLWVCNIDVGHNYGEILDRGMRLIVVEEGDEPKVKPNPRRLG